MSNLLLIAGSGRNAGKTHLACMIIRHLAKHHEVIALKISSHFHSYLEEDVIVRTRNFILIDERKISAKDSSLMVQSGAKRAFFLMAAHENLAEAMDYLLKYLSGAAVVCEAGGLHEVIEPGLFLFVQRSGQANVKECPAEFSPIKINNDGKNFNFDIQDIRFQNHRFSLRRNQPLGMQP